MEDFLKLTWFPGPTEGVLDLKNRFGKLQNAETFLAEVSIGQVIELKLPDVVLFHELVGGPSQRCSRISRRRAARNTFAASVSVIFGILVVTEGLLSNLFHLRATHCGLRLRCDRRRTRGNTAGGLDRKGQGPPSRPSRRSPGSRGSLSRGHLLGYAMLSNIVPNFAVALKALDSGSVL